MTHSLITEPIVGERAFREDESAAVQSRAAILLLLGRQLRDRPTRVADRVAESRPNEGSDDDSGQLRVPTLIPGSSRVRPEEARNELRRRMALSKNARVSGKLTGARFAELFQRIQADPTVENVQVLLEGGIEHSDLLTRVCSAWAKVPTSGADTRIVRTLVKGTHSEDELTREIATAALSQQSPDHRVLRELRQSPRCPPGSESDARALIVHGTWASSEPWWKPGGNFHSFVRASVRPGVYSKNDRFGWSGGYSNEARELAATELVSWCSGRALTGIDYFAHSHGANVCLLASGRGLDAGTLVLLSCPVHPAKYWPNPLGARRVVSVHVKLDLVILLDGGGQTFRTPAIEEHKLSIWFKHGATHDPDVWRKHGLKQRLKL